MDYVLESNQNIRVQFDKSSLINAAKVFFPLPNCHFLESQLLLWACLSVSGVAASITWPHNSKVFLFVFVFVFVFLISKYKYKYKSISPLGDSSRVSTGFCQVV